MGILSLSVDRSAQAADWPAVAFYRDMFDRRSSQALHTIARVKRFMERFRADAQWRAALRSEPARAQALFEAKGIELGAASMAPVWQPGADVQGDAAPLRLWQEWSADLARYRELGREAADTSAQHPRFEVWRRRQLRRLAHELEPVNAQAISSPLVAYELSRGCSVGCWFCGISAARFGGHLPYDPSTARLWQGILEALVERFGPSAATGFCYWATDPCDNPDYCRFIEDHRRITGMLPLTTTAVPMRSLALTREILALGERHRHGNNRFSVLTLKALDQIHQTFDADELLRVDLVLHMNGSLTPKAKAGRGLRQQERIQRLAPADRLDGELEQTSIACVTGFLVNLPDRTIRLVSPCRADEHRPDGYHVFGVQSFDDVASFATAIDRLVTEEAIDHPKPQTVLAFHPTVRTHFEGHTLVVRSPGQIARVMPFPFLPRLVELIEERRYSFNELMAIFAANAPGELLSVGVVLQDLFESGLFDEAAHARPVPARPFPSAPMSQGVQPHA